MSLPPVKAVSISSRTTARDTVTRLLPARMDLPVGSYGAPLLALCVLVGTAMLALSPHSHGPACLVRAITGIPCPGCGLTRSLSSIWHGRWLLSFRYHPLGLPLFGLCLGCLLCAVSDRWYPRGKACTRRIRAGIVHPATLVGFAAVMLVLWLVRLALSRAGSQFFLW